MIVDRAHHYVPIFDILCTCCYDLIFPSAQEHGVGMDGKHSVLICLNPPQTSTLVGVHASYY